MSIVTLNSCMCTCGTLQRWNLTQNGCSFHRNWIWEHWNWNGLDYVNIGVWNVLGVAYFFGPKTLQKRIGNINVTNIHPRVANRSQIKAIVNDESIGNVRHCIQQTWMCLRHNDLRMQLVRLLWHTSCFWLTLSELVSIVSCILPFITEKIEKKSHLERDIWFHSSHFSVENPMIFLSYTVHMNWIYCNWRLAWRWNVFVKSSPLAPLTPTSKTMSIKSLYCTHRTYTHRDR